MTKVVVKVAGFREPKSKNSVQVGVHRRVDPTSLQIGKRVFWEDPRSGEIIIGKITGLEYTPADENCKVQLSLYNGEKVQALPRDLSLKDRV